MTPTSIITLNRTRQVVSDLRQPPPASRAPCRRDQEVFRRVAIGGEQQAAIARELEISKGRVSQIVARVRRWLAQGAPDDPEFLTWRERQRLERSLALARQEAIYKEAMREAARQRDLAKVTIVRTETKEGEETKTVTTVREQGLNVQLLKTAQRAAMEVERVTLRAAVADPPPAMPSEMELFQALLDALCEARQRVEEAGQVTSSGDVYTLVKQVLSALLGHGSCFGMAHNPAAWELVRRLAYGEGAVERPAANSEPANKATDKPAQSPPGLDRAKPFSAASTGETAVVQRQAAAASGRQDSGCEQPRQAKTTRSAAQTPAKKPEKFSAPTGGDAAVMPAAARATRRIRPARSARRSSRQPKVRGRA